MQHFGYPFANSGTGSQGLALRHSSDVRSCGSATEGRGVLADVAEICAAIDGFLAGMGSHVADYARHCENYGLHHAKLYELAHECLTLDIKRISAAKQAAMTLNQAPFTPSQSEASSDSVVSTVKQGTPLFD